jgi:inorganic triphosphatase YgiF
MEAAHPLGQHRLQAHATQQLQTQFISIQPAMPSRQINASLRIRIVNQTIQFITIKTSQPDIGDVSVRHEYEIPLNIG